MLKIFAIINFKTKLYQIAYSTIQNADLKNLVNEKNKNYEIHISCKNFLFIQFTFSSEKKAYEVFTYLKKLINISKC